MRKASWVACGLLGVGALLTGACGDGGGDGAPAAGGSASGGAVAAGGKTNSGGGVATGGKPSGGGPASGGATATGGGVATGGVFTADGGSSPGGEGGMGGEDGMGGTPSGGAASTGGVPGAGGTTPRPACEKYPSLTTGSSSFTVSVQNLTSCGTIPAIHTCDDQPFPRGGAPKISWTAGPGGMSGTKSYAVVFKDLSVLDVTAPSDKNYNKGYHYAIWDIDDTVRELPANMSQGHRPTETDLTSARQWSNFNNYSWFGPCPNFDPAMPTDYIDTYSFVVYALSVDKAVVPQPVTGISPVRAMDDYFKTVALATAEFRGTSDAAASVIPSGVLPPTAKAPCPTTGDQPEGCVK